MERVPLRCIAVTSRPDRTMCTGLLATWAALKVLAGENDGAVPVSSSSWGDQVLMVPADHFEEVGLATFFDGPAPITHFDIRAGLYQGINQWQRTMAD